MRPSKLLKFFCTLVQICALEKHLTDDQWKLDAPELNFECHIKVSEYLCICYIFGGVFLFKKQKLQAFQENSNRFVITESCV